MTAAESLKQLLIVGAEELGVRLSEAQADSCLLYLSELGKWNRKINLTAVREDREIIIKHFLDSLAFIRGFRREQDTAILDMGSGAGFPALPIKIACPGLSVTLIESVKKKTSFLRHIVRMLGISGVEIVGSRTDQLPETFNHRFDAVTARAFAAMNRVLTEGVRFLKPAGSAVLSRGPEEGIDGDVLERLGFVLEKTESLILPYSGYRRVIWVFKKIG